MKHVFDENNQWTSKANEIDREFGKVLKEVFEKFENEDLSLREIAYIAHKAIDLEETTRLSKRRRKC